MRPLIFFIAASFIVSSGMAAEIPATPFWVRNGTSLIGDTFWSVGRDPGGAVSVANADAQEQMTKIVSRNLAALGSEFESTDRTASGTPDLLSGFATNCTKDSWVINEHWTDPRDRSVYSLRRLERSTVLECVETTGDLNDDLKQFLRSKLINAGDASSRDRSVQMSITIDSVERKRIPLLSTLAHWYRFKYYIKGTIHGDVIDKQGRPVSSLRIRAHSNSWPRNPTIRETLSPTRGWFPGDQTDFEVITDTNGSFQLPFSGYVGIRNNFTVGLGIKDRFTAGRGDFESFMIFREGDGNIYAKYFFGYRRIPITSKP